MDTYADDLAGFRKALGLEEGRFLSVTRPAAAKWYVTLVATAKTGRESRADWGGVAYNAEDDRLIPAARR